MRYDGAVAPRATPRFFVAALAAAVAANALADPRPEPEGFRDLEHRFEEFDAALRGSHDLSGGWMKSQVAIVRELRLEYLHYSRSAPSEWRVASVFRVANVLERFADTVSAGRLPESLVGDGGSAVAFRDEVSERIEYLRHQAHMEYEGAVNLAAVLGVENSWAALARDGERRLRLQGRPCKSAAACGTADYLCIGGTCRFIASMPEPLPEPQAIPSVPPKEIVR
jgi:hypothetical protein